MMRPDEKHGRVWKKNGRAYTTQEYRNARTVRTQARRVRFEIAPEQLGPLPPRDEIIFYPQNHPLSVLDTVE
jgi:hypothetical protein